MTIRLASYRPLMQSWHGRKAITQFALPPFIDGSCRREPDFESAYPSISALCRAAKLAPRLDQGDEVIYITTKCGNCWYLVARLRVRDRFVSHAQAAAWYTSQGVQPPSNCMTSGTRPVPYEQTSGRWLSETETRGTANVLAFWDGTYRKRARMHPIFLACDSVYHDLHHPVKLTKNCFLRIFNRVPGTQNPPAITPAQANALMSIAANPSSRRYP